MQPLQAGDRVRVFNTERQDWQRAGTVLNEVAPRSYAVQTDTGAVVRRNRLQLLKTQAGNAVPSIEEHRDKCAQHGTETDNQPGVLEENAPVLMEPEAAPERRFNFAGSVQRRIKIRVQKKESKRGRSIGRYTISEPISYHLTFVLYTLALDF
ncbi:hypothetical protein N1851_024782 [Merluccius polli]|uniref:Uncharacterized protein n=1 Tax=Merluccius polli TaxID=89951 RepID=A0AA47ME99_MERPO|nr:hypothetical protein N1851_024782 [Merluccius polli]